MNEYVDTNVIRAATGWSISYIYRLASRDHWRRTKTGRTVRYHWHDVAQTIDRSARA